jgi:hypothetical protein
VVRWLFVYMACVCLLRCLQVFGNNLCTRRYVHTTLYITGGRGGEGGGIA